MSRALTELEVGAGSFETAALEAAERSGALDAVLTDLAEVLEQQCAVRERVISALIYPSLVVLLGVAVAVLMLGLLVPKAAEMLEGTEAGLPLLTRGMLQLGRVFPLLVVVAVCLAGGAWLVVRRRSNREQRRVAMDRWLMRVPLLGATREKLCAMRLCRTLTVLVRGGVALVDALPVAGDASGSHYTAMQLRELALGVRDGGSVSDALGALDPLGPLLVDWARVGESGGNLDKMLSTAADRFALQWERSVSRILSLLEPLLILLIGGFVLLVSLSVLLPVLTLSRSMG